MAVKSEYVSILQSLKYILKTEGVSSLYRYDHQLLLLKKSFANLLYQFIISLLTRYISLQKNTA